MYSRADDLGWKQSNAFKKAFCMDVDIEFLGVWYVIVSLGTTFSPDLHIVGIRSARLESSHAGYPLPLPIQSSKHSDMQYRLTNTDPSFVQTFSTGQMHTKKS